MRLVEFGASRCAQIFGSPKTKPQGELRFQVAVFLRMRGSRTNLTQASLTGQCGSSLWKFNMPGDLKNQWMVPECSRSGVKM